MSPTVRENSRKICFQLKSHIHAVHKHAPSSKLFHTPTQFGSSEPRGFSWGRVNYRVTRTNTLMETPNRSPQPGQRRWTDHNTSMPRTALFSSKEDLKIPQTSWLPFYTRLDSPRTSLHKSVVDMYLWMPQRRPNLRLLPIVLQLRLIGILSSDPGLPDAEACSYIFLKG
jgi:hypothetical protein